MEREGFDYFLTPLRAWLSAACLRVQRSGGEPMPLLAYRAEQERQEHDLKAALRKPEDAGTYLDKLIRSNG